MKMRICTLAVIGTGLYSLFAVAESPESPGPYPVGVTTIQMQDPSRMDPTLKAPRPLLVDYLPLYSPHQARRHEVRPGITGWAQGNGRNAISWEQKFDLDVWYVDNQSFLLDLRILALTFIKIIRKDGVNASETVTMPRFEGSPKS